MAMTWFESSCEEERAEILIARTMDRRFSLECSDRGRRGTSYITGGIFIGRARESVCSVHHYLVVN